MKHRRHGWARLSRTVEMKAKVIAATRPDVVGLISDMMDQGAIPRGGVGIYDQAAVHLDIRGKRVAWDWRGGVKRGRSFSWRA